MTASQVSARVNSARIPATASHARRLAEVRKPMTRATSTMITSVSPLETSEVRTCAHSTDDREIGMEWNRSKMPLCRSVNNRRAVYAMPDAIAISMIPGSR